MQEINIGDKTVRLRGSNLSLLYYQQEFGRDLIGDLTKMITSMVSAEALKIGRVDPEDMNLAAFDSVSLLRLIWTLARTAAGPTGNFPSFDVWLQENEELDLLNGELLQTVFEEAQRAFFRSPKTVAPAAQRKRR